MTQKLESRSLAAGGVAAILASSCCLGPLLLVALGFSGAWIGNLTRLEPYRPWFLGVALLCLALAARRIFSGTGSCAATPVAILTPPASASPVGQCASDATCASPQGKKLQKVVFLLVTLLVVVAFAFPYFASFFY